MFEPQVLGVQAAILFESTKAIRKTLNTVSSNDLINDSGSSLGSKPISFAQDLANRTEYHTKLSIKPNKTAMAMAKKLTYIWHGIHPRYFVGVKNSTRVNRRSTKFATYNPKRSRRYRAIPS